MPTQRELADAIRFLSIDAVQKANSGHPGMPMGMADIAEVLWRNHLRHNPNNPDWPNRDRFVVSNGHGSMLLYSLLHLTGYDLSIDDLKSFRQLHSKTPGHPEYRETPGVETTTGPLGQGLANAVGMAIAEKHLGATFNQPHFSIVDHYTYCFVGDGCLMEGISHEACSLAGTLGLGKLIVFYDDNQISIDGDVSGWFRDKTTMRFEAYGWQVLKVDGHDPVAIDAAIVAAKANTAQPTLICCDTTIGFGSPNKAGTAEVHGAALGEKEVALVREKLQWSHRPFEIHEDIYDAWNAKQKGALLEADWQTLFTNYTLNYPELSIEFTRRMDGMLPIDFKDQSDAFINSVNDKKETVATRKASQHALDFFANYLPEIMGGSADLTESNCTNWKGMTVFTAENPAGEYIHYGVREFGMSAIMNGLALHGGIIPFGGTFLVFSDYAKNAVRLASMMKIRTIFVYTHDSIGLGEDGPTHQPVEQLPTLRMIPNHSVWRPCDTVETAVAWQQAIERRGSTSLLLSRQALSFQERDAVQIKNITCGGYILIKETKQTPDIILIATGSEVALAVSVAAELKTSGVDARVVSMPSVDVFLSQEEAYQEAVLPKEVPLRIAIEAAASLTWYQFVGLRGKIIGLDRFGASAPAKDVYRDCSFTVEHVTAVAKELLNTKQLSSII